MVRIYVARHGQDADNAAGILNGHRDEPLTDRGREQAREVGHKMLQAGFALSSSGASPPSSPAAPSTASVVLDAVYSSPLKRAFHTAEIFVELLSNREGEADGASQHTPSSAAATKVEVLDDLIERDFGIMTGQPTKSIVEKCGIDHILATETINYFLDPDGAETFPDLIQRAKRLLSHFDTMTEKNTNTSILLVTHGDFGKMLYAAYYDLEWVTVLRQFHFGNSEVLLLSKDSPPEKAHVFETVLLWPFQAPLWQSLPQ
ncbi:hypothetical protein ACHAXT_009267 [Thalassiosira profunda]